ncbi:elongation factor P maturation arginine rhamnosyltransferase EarP [Ramlibacter sp. 2FC]|uniref:elongation factor P maturation arginine rhamnosyltransferase EarP n=1 Tax=Ramlibacter sp. 2FC TaxID=2502188 RepID=UPI0010F7754C|nr:elongation factor P maturation arginine rhamnosyltransferase EarP [Ramlibacter sp. 2FC]
MLWDIFCTVIDNHGDLGVCWRLSAQLAARGEQVRLWVDDASALSWMAPGALEGRVPGVQVLPWTRPLPGALLTALAPSEVWVEAFGCDLPAEFLAHFVADDEQAPVWLNLEYLSAEPYVERCHALPSPVMSGPGRGRTKWFFYPGFTARTGGLLREAGLLARQAAFDRGAWLKALGQPAVADERLVALFCYEPPMLASLLERLGRGHPPTRLLVTAGRAAAAVRACGASPGPSLAVDYLPPMPQTGFDQLLWACALNFVRGEDSLVRALWAGAPLVWQIYPQHDDAHHTKLEAFLAWLEAPASLRRFHRVWNDMAPGPLPEIELPLWRDCMLAARRRLLAQDELVTQLLRFVTEKR